MQTLCLNKAITERIYLQLLTLLFMYSDLLKGRDAIKHCKNAKSSYILFKENLQYVFSSLDFSGSCFNLFFWSLPECVIVLGTNMTFHLWGSNLVEISHQVDLCSFKVLHWAFHLNSATQQHIQKEMHGTFHLSLWCQQTCCKIKLLDVGSKIKIKGIKKPHKGVQFCAQ